MRLTELTAVKAIAEDEIGEEDKKGKERWHKEQINKEEK
jgi:hypothetical protein